MGAGIESKPARATQGKSDWVNILEELPLVFGRACISEPRAIFESRDVSPKYTRSTPVQTAHEHVPVLTCIVAFRNRI